MNIEYRKVPHQEPSTARNRNCLAPPCYYRSSRFLFNRGARKSKLDVSGKMHDENRKIALNDNVHVMHVYLRRRHNEAAPICSFGVPPYILIGFLFFNFSTHSTCNSVPGSLALNWLENQIKHSRYHC